MTFIHVFSKFSLVKSIFYPLGETIFFKERKTRTFLIAKFSLGPVFESASGILSKLPIRTSLGNGLISCSSHNPNQRIKPVKLDDIFGLGWLKIAT